MASLVVREKDRMTAHAVNKIRFFFFVSKIGAIAHKIFVSHIRKVFSPKLSGMAAGEKLQYEASYTFWQQSWLARPLKTACTWFGEMISHSLKLSRSGIGSHKHVHRSIFSQPFWQCSPKTFEKATEWSMETVHQQSSRTGWEWDWLLDSFQAG